MSYKSTEPYQAKLTAMNFPAYHFDDNLWEVPDSVRDFQEFIHEMEASKEKSMKQLIGLGVAYRIVRELEKSEEYLREALVVACKSNQLPHIFAAKIRLAHCFQWQRQYGLSNAIFEELEQEVSSVSTNLQSSFWQHKGKNEFDQGHYLQALNCFKLALDMRVQNKSPQDVIESSQLAVFETKQRIKKIKVQNSSS